MQIQMPTVSKASGQFVFGEFILRAQYQPQNETHHCSEDEEVNVFRCHSWEQSSDHHIGHWLKSLNSFSSSRRSQHRKAARQADNQSG